jgi:hypothetical protein
MTTITAIEFHKGETWVINFTAKDAAGAALNITGATIQWKLGAHEANIANGEIAITDAPNGVCVVTVPPASQTALAPGLYTQECKVTLASGVVSTQVAGAFELKGTMF